MAQVRQPSTSSHYEEIVTAKRNGALETPSMLMTVRRWARKTAQFWVDLKWKGARVMFLYGYFYDLVGLPLTVVDSQWWVSYPINYTFLNVEIVSNISCYMPHMI